MLSAGQEAGPQLVKVVACFFQALATGLSKTSISLVKITPTLFTSRNNVLYLILAHRNLSHCIPARCKLLNHITTCCAALSTCHITSHSIASTVTMPYDITTHHITTFHIELSSKTYNCRRVMPPSHSFYRVRAVCCLAHFWCQKIVLACVLATFWPLAW